MEGYISLACFFFLFFLASWLFGFLAFWLLGFWAFQLFVGLCGFWWRFGFGFSHPLHSQFLFGRWRVGFGLFASFAFTVPLWVFWLLHPFIIFWIWLPASSASPVPPYLNHHFFEHHGREAPPQPTRYCLDCLQSNCTPIRINTSSNMGGPAAPQPPRYFLDFLQRLNCTPIRIITSANIMGGGCRPPHPPATF